MIPAEDDERGSMSLWGANRRTLIDMALAFAVAIVLAILNVAINFIDHIHHFFATYSQFAITEVIVNALFVWLAVLLWVSFVRWRAAARKRAELEEIVSSISPDVLLVVAPDRTIRMCNASVQRLFGHAQDAIIGQKTDLLYKDRREHAAGQREIHDALMQDGFHLGMATGMRKDGSEIPLEIITGHLSGGDGAVLLLRDISERVHAEEEQERLEERMQQQQKLESLGILAGGVAHDFNNLLTVMLGNAELIRQTAQPRSELAEQVDGICRASVEAAELCAQMLAYAGQGDYRIQPVDLAMTISKMTRLLEVPLPKGAKFELHLGRDLPAIHADAVQIQQILMNLVTNSADAVGPGSGQVNVSASMRDCDAALAERISIDRPLEPGPYVMLEVSDNGKGMDADTKARMFDPFFTTKFMGRGLGLASLLGIVRAHKGGLEVETAPQQGTTFRIYFPTVKTESSDSE